MGHAFNWLFSFPRRRRKQSSSNSQTSTRLSAPTDVPQQLNQSSEYSDHPLPAPDSKTALHSPATIHYTFSNQRKSDHHKSTSHINPKQTDFPPRKHSAPSSSHPQKPVPITTTTRPPTSAPPPSTKTHYSSAAIDSNEQSYFGDDSFVDPNVTQPPAFSQFPPFHSDANATDPLSFRNLSRSTSNPLQPVTSKLDSDDDDDDYDHNNGNTNHQLQGDESTAAQNSNPIEELISSSERLRRLKRRQKHKSETHQKINDHHHIPSTNFHNTNYDPNDLLESRLGEQTIPIQHNYNHPIHFEQHQNYFPHHHSRIGYLPTSPQGIPSTAYPPVDGSILPPVHLRSPHLPPPSRVPAHSYTTDSNLQPDAPEPASGSLSPPRSLNSSTNRKHSARSAGAIASSASAGPSSLVDNPSYYQPNRGDSNTTSSSAYSRSLNYHHPHPHSHHPSHSPQLTNPHIPGRRLRSPRHRAVPIPNSIHPPSSFPLDNQGVQPTSHFLSPSNSYASAAPQPPSSFPTDHNSTLPLGGHDPYSASVSRAKAAAAAAATAAPSPDRVPTPIVPPQTPPPVAQPSSSGRVSTDEGEVSDSYDSGREDQETQGRKKVRSRYHRIFRGGQGRFLLNRSASSQRQKSTDQQGIQQGTSKTKNSKSDTTSARVERQDTATATPQDTEIELGDDERIFGTQEQHEDNRVRASDLRRPGEQALVKFIRSTLGTNAEQLAVRLMNKTPLPSTNRFTYKIFQGTEDSDVDIIRRDLNSGRCFVNGMRLTAGGWCNLLLGDRFTPGSSSKQKHELTYIRSTCSCIVCMVRAKELEQKVQAEEDRRNKEQQDLENRYGTDVTDSLSQRTSAEILSHMSTASRTPIHSAMANFVVVYELPSHRQLLSIGGASSSNELEIGSVIRLNYRASAKLRFTDDARGLFGHFAYTGPISHEEMFRRITTIGVRYYLYNKGKKERKVYIQGQLIRIPINVGVVKLGTQPMYLSEVGATFCLYRKQIMSIYVGELVLEGNSMGSFIKTGIRYYIGFGEERGVCPVYPNKTLGRARKLGVNELLLHHHMVEDLQVNCL